jgi:hypothetical protein
MAVTTITYSTDTAITIDVSALTSSSTGLVGCESNEIDNTTNKYVDAIVTCDGITGHASTAPTVGQLIAVYVWGSDVSLATTAIDTLDGTASGETLASAAFLNGALALAAQSVVTDTTAARKFPIKPFAIAQFFGGNMPKFWGLYVTHSHTGTLGASQSTMFSFNGITYTTA